MAQNNFKNMKEVRKEYQLCESQRSQKRLEYNKLDQISMQGSEGRRILEEITLLEGMMKVYKKLIQKQKI